MKKNFIIVLLGAVTCIAVALGIWLAVYLGRHIHDYGGWVTDNGYHWRECKNDGCNEKLIDKSAHSDADNDGKCDICLTEHEHPFVKTVTAPNCTKQGYTEYICPCGYHYRGDYTDELGHDFDDDNLCTRCGYLKHDHEYIEKVIPPTCTEGGYTRGDCKYCTAGYFSAHTDPLGHDYADGKCTRCGEWKPTDGLVYTLSSDGNYYICSGIGTATDTQIVIAPEYNGKPVTIIAQRAFYNNRNITNVIISDTVTSIGASAFEYCTALSEITIPDSVTSVGSKAFYNCTGMVGATVGGCIGNDMFQYCTKLETVVVCDGVTSIGSWAFAGCEKLETAMVPDSVTSIGEHAFRNCKSLKEINIPDGVTEICEGTFWYCSSLTDLKIPDSVKSIGKDAFFGLKIRSATIPMAAVKDLSETYHVNWYLTTVVISSGEAIYEEAFSGWKIKNITLPDSIRAIGSKAFRDCPLYAITYNGTVEQWNAVIKSDDWDDGISHQFYVCCIDGDIIGGFNEDVSGTRAVSIALNKVNVELKLGQSETLIATVQPASAENKNVVWISTDESVVTVEDGIITGVGYGAANIYAEIDNGDIRTYCTVTVGEFKFGLSMKTDAGIASYSVSGVKSLMVGDIVIPPEYQGYRVYEIYDAAFYGCINITSISIPKYVRYISASAFQGCTALSDIYYDGTKEEWDAITKEQAWNYNTYDYTIHCLDGDFGKYEN